MNYLALNLLWFTSILVIFSVLVISTGLQLIKKVDTRY